MGLFDYQKTGIEFLHDTPRAMLADAPGLGKTIQAIKAADRGGARNILVVSTASSLINWRREFLRWQEIPRELVIVRNRTIPAKSGQDDAGQVLIISYGQLSRGADLPKMLECFDLDLIIFDEAHALKNQKAKRTKTAYGRDGLVSRAPRVILLTGTPVTNTAAELYTHFRALWPDRMPRVGGKPVNQWQWEDRFCVTRNTPFGRQIVGNRLPAMGELKRMLDGVMLRRRKEDVLQDLPALRFDTVLLDASKIDLTMLDDLELAGDDDDVLRQLASQVDSFAVARKQLGLAKAAPAADWIIDALEGGENKIIVFGYHLDVLHELHVRLAAYHPVRVQGSHSAEERQQAVDSFQNDPGARVFIGQLTACREALTLTAASRVVFVEAGFTPAENYQAACRAHRIGQKDSVLAEFLCFANSLDERIHSMLTRKTRDIVNLIGEF